MLSDAYEDVAVNQVWIRECMKLQSEERKSLDKIKIVGILGSPRTAGNTDILLSEALRGAEDEGAQITRLDLNSLQFIPCQECGGCDLAGECAFHDDMDRIYEAVAAAEGILIASPIFFGSLAAQTKMMIDRFQAWWVAKYRLKKPVPQNHPRLGVFICVGAIDTEHYCRSAEDIINIWFVNIDVLHWRSLLYHGYDSAGSIRRHSTATKDAYQTGGGVVREIRRIRQEGS